MESGEGVQAFYAAHGFPFGAADTGDPGAVAGEVVGVDLIHNFRADFFLRGADATPGFDARNGRTKGGAGDPEARWHLSAALVLYYAGTVGRTPGGHAERRRLATELECHGLTVVQRSSFSSSTTMYTCSPGFIMP